jgi:hypothetical protein
MLRASDFKAVFLTIRSLGGTFRRQGIPWASLLIFVVFILGLIFAFFVAAPILSPLVYPLF